MALYILKDKVSSSGLGVLHTPSPHPRAPTASWR